MRQFACRLCGLPGPRGDFLRPRFRHFVCADIDACTQRREAAADMRLAAVQLRALVAEIPEAATASVLRERGNQVCTRMEQIRAGHDVLTAGRFESKVREQDAWIAWNEGNRYLGRLAWHIEQAEGTRRDRAASGKAKTASRSRKPAKVWEVWAVLGLDKSLLRTFDSEEKAREWAATEGQPMDFEPMPYSTRIVERDVY